MIFILSVLRPHLPVQPLPLSETVRSVGSTGPALGYEGSGPWRTLRQLNRNISLRYFIWIYVWSLTNEWYKAFLLMFPQFLFPCACTSALRTVLAVCLFESTSVMLGPEFPEPWIPTVHLGER